MKYENSFLRQAKSGTWRGVLKYRDSQGNWKQLSKTLEATGKRAALKELQAWRNEMEELHEALAIERESDVAKKTEETIEEYVSRYIRGKINSVERSTLSGYQVLLRRQIAPFLGSLSIDDVTPDMVQEWLNELSNSYNPITVKKAFILFKSAMTQAVERDILSKNPTRTVNPPKLPSSKPNALTEQERATVIGLLSTPNLSAEMLGVKIALYTGLREGEICGLKWKNVNLEACTIYVEETIGRDNNGYYVKDPKTGGSKRTVYFPKDLCNNLRSRHVDAKRDSLIKDTPFTNDCYVLCNVGESFMRPKRLWRKWRSIAEALELMGTQNKRPTFHDLRHSYATTAIASGIDIKTVSSSMGHANAAMTLNIYASVDPEAQRRAAKKLGEVYAQEALRFAV